VVVLTPTSLLPIPWYRRDRAITRHFRHWSADGVAFTVFVPLPSPIAALQDCQ